MHKAKEAYVSKAKSMTIQVDGGMTKHADEVLHDAVPLYVEAKILEATKPDTFEKYNAREICIQATSTLTSFGFTIACLHPLVKDRLTKSKKMQRTPSMG